MSFLKRNMASLAGMVGSLCMALVYVIHWRGCCLLFFGEYPFPEE